MSFPLLGLHVSAPGSIERATVSSIDDEHGHVLVQMPGASGEKPCLVLAAGGSSPVLQPFDEVLIWHDGTGSAVVLGRVAAYDGEVCTEGSTTEPSTQTRRPSHLVLEAEGDIVLRNRHARLRIGADGEVELVCNGLSARSRRWLRLLGSVIHLN